MSLSNRIRFFHQYQAISLRNRNRLKSYIQGIFKREGRSLEGLNYIFCSDKELLKINREYLNHDFYTDIITFELSAPGAPVQGEIYISVDRVKDNAGSLGFSFNSELHRVIFHGALHLCGYRDKSKKEIEEIRKKEDYYLSGYLK
ncbi:MAG: rRNA maturation RNase YbeY [Chitinophagaceae bacterium]